MSFFNELKRRNVFRVGAAYLVVAWLLLQIMDTVAPIIGLSDSFARGVLFLIVLGLPIVLVVSWIFELTPQGLQTQAEADQSGARTYASKLNTLIIGGLSLVIVLLVVDNYVLVDGDVSAVQTVAEDSADASFQGEITQTGNLEKSIAVLPFENQSNDEDQEYFSDGLTDELINTLSQVQDLLVIGRNSSFYFKDSDEDLREIGELLDVSYILQGSVRKAGNQLRVTAQLMEANSGFLIWSENYDRELADVFAIQDEIAEEVTTNLSISLGVGEFDRPGMTRNVAAYDAYLRGVQVFLEQGLEPKEAIIHLREAVDLDSDFALAWATLSRAYYLDLVSSPIDEMADINQLEVAAGRRANDLAPDMPEIMSFNAQQVKETGNWLEADRLFREQVALYGDSDSRTNADFGKFLRLAGKSSEALVYLQRAKRLDPLNPTISQDLGLTLLSLNRLEEGVAEADRGLALNSAIALRFLHAIKTVAAYIDNDLELAISTLEVTSPGDEEFDVALPLVRQLAAGEVDNVVGQLREKRQQNVAPIEFAILGPVAALTGDAELAMSYFFDPRVDDSHGFWQPFSRAYYNEPEMKQQFRDSGLVTYWQASGWNDFCQPIEGTEDDFECF